MFDLVYFFSFRVWAQHTCPLFFSSPLSLFSSTRTRTRTRTQKARWGCYSLEGDYHYTTIICTPLSSYFPGSKSSEPFNPHTSLEVRARSPLIFFFFLCPFSSPRTRTRTRTQKARWGCHSLEGDYHYTTIICTPLFLVSGTRTRTQYAYAAWFLY